jgi:hypothetical protein
VKAGAAAGNTVAVTPEVTPEAKGPTTPRNGPPKGSALVGLPLWRAYWERELRSAIFEPGDLEGQRDHIFLGPLMHLLWLNGLQGKVGEVLSYASQSARAADPAADSTNSVGGQQQDEKVGIDQVTGGSASGGPPASASVDQSLSPVVNTDVRDKKADGAVKWWSSEARQTIARQPTVEAQQEMKK